MGFLFFVFFAIGRPPNRGEKNEHLEFLTCSAFMRTNSLREIASQPQSVNNPLGALGDADRTIDGEMTIKARMLKAGVIQERPDEDREKRITS